MRFSAPGLAIYGAGAGIVLVYFTSNWKGKDILQYAPIYNRKYVEKDPEMA